MEFQEGGFRPEECRDVVSKLAEEGVTFIELSGGTYETWVTTMAKDSCFKEVDLIWFISERNLAGR